MAEQSEYVWLVEQYPRYENEQHKPAHITAPTKLSQEIQLDQKLKAGKYRRKDRIPCAHCLNQKGVRTPTIATTYVGPGGQRIIEFPSRRVVPRSDGVEPMNKTRQAMPFEDSDGEVTQCKQCLRHYFVACDWTNSHDNRPPHLRVFPVVETTLGKETGEGLFITHKVLRTMAVEKIVHSKKLKR